MLICLEWHIEPTTTPNAWLATGPQN